MEESNYMSAMREAYEKRSGAGKRQRRRMMARHYDVRTNANAGKPGWIAEVSPGVYVMSRRPKCCLVNKLDLATRYESHKAAMSAARWSKGASEDPQAFHVNAQGERSSP
jgi:hypothetical protein